MKKYKIITGWHREILEETINYYSERGWEFVNMYPIIEPDHSAIYVIMRKELEDKNTVEEKE